METTCIQTGIPQRFRGLLEIVPKPANIVLSTLFTNMLEACFADLPKLRAFHFTDFRGRTRRGESYGDLCIRLFGNTLEPAILGDRDWN